MSEHLALDESDQSLPIVAKPVRVRVARHVSNILSPATISVPFVVAVALYHTRNTLAALTYACVTLFFLSFGPMIYIIVGVRKGKFTDIDVSVRSQRLRPFLRRMVVPEQEILAGSGRILRDGGGGEKDRQKQFVHGTKIHSEHTVSRKPGNQE